MRTDPAKQTDLVRQWVSINIGDVLSIERQQRWRPAWFITARQRNGQIKRLYVRGDREGFGAATVAAEAAVLKVLESNGIPVPHVYGEVDGLGAVVMDWLPGDADLSAAAGPSQVDAVMDSYIDALYRAHQIEPEAFVDAGLRVPADPESLALADFETFVARFRQFKKRPEPLLEFGIGWLRRNAPRGNAEPRFVLGDTGQFIYENQAVTGLLDVELAHIGDVCHDLAGLRLRGVTEYMGDLGRALKRYEALSEQPLDVPSIEFHTAKFALCTPLGVAVALHLDLAVPEVLQYIEWFHQLSLHAIEAMARCEGVQLSAIDLPESGLGAYHGVVTGLCSMVAALPAPDPMGRYQRDVTAKVAQFCARVHAFQASIDEADLDDLGDMLGCRPADRASGELALETFVLDAEPELDGHLISLMHRRVMRQLLLIEPLMASGGIGHVTPLAELLDSN